MRSVSATAEGFRLIFRRPAIPMAEIAWRWSFAAAFWFLAIMFVVEYSDSLSVNTVDRLLLGTRQPALILRALHRIFHGSALRFTTGGILVSISITIAWIILSSLGRAATLNAVMEQLGITSAPGRRRDTVSSLLALNWLRAAAALAAIIAGCGTALVASGVWASTHLSASGAARFWVALLFLVWSAWGILNWVFSTSTLFVARDRLSAFGAVSASVGWYRDRLGSFIGAGTWFGLIHGGAFLTAWSAAFTVLSMAGILGRGPTLLLEFLIVAVYCAVADFLYIGRLTAYLSIIRDGETFDLLQSQSEPSASPTPGRASIDQSELILSDGPVT